MSLGTSAARGTGVTLLTQALRTLLLFGSMVALARLLVPEDFGLVAMVAAVIGIADLVRDFGLSLAVMQSPTLSDDERTNLFWANLGFGVGCTVVAVAATPLIVLGYGEERLTPIVLSLAAVFTISGFTTQYRAGLARDMRYKALGLTDVTAQAVSIAVAVALAATGAGFWALVAQQITAAVVSAALCVRLGGWWPGLPRRATSIRRFLRFGGGVFGTQSITYVTKNVDNVAIGAALGAGPLGLYSRGYQLMMMPLNQVNAPMTQVALPVLSRVQQDDERFLAYLQKAQLVACYLTATLFAVATGLADPIVRVLFGPVWLDVVPIFAVLAVGGLFRAVAQIAYWAYLARGLAGSLLRQRLVTGPISIALILAGLPWGVVGVAAGHTAGALISWIVAVLHAGRAAGLDTRPLLWNAIRTILQIGVPCGLAAHAATYLAVPAFFQLLLGLVAAGLWVLLARLLFSRVRSDLALTMGFARQAVQFRRSDPAKRGRQP